MILVSNLFHGKTKFLEPIENNFVKRGTGHGYRFHIKLVMDDVASQHKIVLSTLMMRF